MIIIIIALALSYAHFQDLKTNKNI